MGCHSLCKNKEGQHPSPWRRLLSKDGHPSKYRRLSSVSPCKVFFYCIWIASSSWPIHCQFFDIRFLASQINESNNYLPAPNFSRLIRVVLRRNLPQAYSILEQSIRVASSQSPSKESTGREGSVPPALNSGVAATSTKEIESTINIESLSPSRVFLDRKQSFLCVSDFACLFESFLRELAVQSCLSTVPSITHRDVYR